MSRLCMSATPPEGDADPRTHLSPFTDFLFKDRKALLIHSVMVCLGHMSTELGENTFSVVDYCFFCRILEYTSFVVDYIGLY